MRDCTQTENSRNSRKRRGATSKYLGVSWHKGDDAWHAKIGLHGKVLHLGCYGDEIAAARAYDAAARKHFGEFANPNFDDLRAGAE